MGKWNMTRYLAAALLCLSSTPAYAQAETEFFKSIFGVSISLGLLLLLVIAIFRFFLGERKELKDANAALVVKLEKAVTDKEALLREVVTLARDNSDAFKDATKSIKDFQDFMKAADDRNFKSLATITASLSAKDGA